MCNPAIPIARLNQSQDHVNVFQGVGNSNPISS
jgi:hypothetical protein